jgi:hypothetical protein
MFRITEKRELFRIQWNSQRQFLKSGEEPFLIPDSQLLIPNFENLIRFVKINFKNYLFVVE